VVAATEMCDNQDSKPLSVLSPFVTHTCRIFDENSPSWGLENRWSLRGTGKKRGKQKKITALNIASKGQKLGNLILTREKGGGK